MKTVWTWAGALIAIFAPIRAAAICAVILVFCDLITGVWAAHTRDEPITSSGLKDTVYKLLVYELAVALAFLAQTYLTGTVLPVCNLATTVVGLTELKSILENLDTISGGSFFQSLISRISSQKDDLT